MCILLVKAANIGDISRRGGRRSRAGWREVRDVIFLALLRINKGYNIKELNTAAKTG